MKPINHFFNPFQISTKEHQTTTKIKKTLKNRDSQSFSRPMTLSMVKKKKKEDILISIMDGLQCLFVGDVAVMTA